MWEDWNVRIEDGDSTINKTMHIYNEYWILTYKVVNVAFHNGILTEMILSIDFALRYFLIKMWRNILSFLSVKRQSVWLMN